MQGIRYHYSALYRDFSKTPELAKFRRYLGLWSWILYNKSFDIDKQVDECDGLISKIHGTARDRSPFTVTDYHRAYEQPEDMFLKVKLGNLEDLVRQYSKDLLMVHAIANLPDQCDMYARHFAQHKEVFENGVFGPTKENEEMYKQVPAHDEMCSLKGFDQQDLITSFVLRHIKTMNKHFRSLMKQFSRKREQQTDVSPEQHIKFETLLLVIDLLAGLYVPLLFAGCMGVLSCIKSEKARIGVLGVFGFVLTGSLILCVPNLRRADLFAVTAAFFAVGGIYIGAKSGDNR
ncbi:Nn.00g057370.m01.CDS01 [Neocucurbitaria sp. VM-36]